MATLSEPLHIGASDLLRGVDYTYCGGLHVQCGKLIGKKWKPRYVIISKGCFYIYKDRNAKTAEHAYSLKHFESAIESEPEGGENICFSLRYKNSQGPLLFSCDTVERRDKWIDRFCSEISEVQSTLYNLSADSGFGSAEAVPKNKSSVDGEYDQVRAVGGAKNTEKGIFYENNEEIQKDDSMTDVREKLLTRNIKQMNKQPSKEMTALTDELKRSLEKKKSSATTEKSILLTDKGFLVKASPERSNSSLLPSELLNSGPRSASSFLSIRSGSSLAGIEESMSGLSVREQEKLYVNEGDTDNSTDRDNTSRKTIYENPEESERKRLLNFKRNEYFCERKERAKRLIKQMPVGSFAVFPGENTEHELCVKTSLGLRYFRIYQQNALLSLYKSHQYDTFLCLDDLLSHYSSNDLPAADYSVQLQRGCNSVP